MNYWRVTKYNPLHREDGADSPYTVDTWTQVEDLHEGKVCVEEYKQVEDSYVNACMLFAKETGLKKIKVVDFINDMTSSEVLIEHKLDLPDSRDDLEEVAIEELADLVRKNLRGVLYCKIEGENNFYIHFGYDFYMYIGSEFSCESAIKLVEESGLFVEEIVSPYLDIED